MSKNFNAKTQQEAVKRVKFADLIRQRILFDKFFEIPGFNCKAYVLSRLYSLTSTVNLKDYSSNASEKYQENNWTVKKPTDTQILAHLFFRLLNNLNNPTVDPNFDMFSDIVVKSTPMSMPINKVLFLENKNYYEILSGSEIWTPHKDPDNLFSAIALFLLHSKQKGDSFFYSIDCREYYNLIS